MTLKRYAGFRCLLFLFATIALAGPTVDQNSAGYSTESMETWQAELEAVAAKLAQSDLRDEALPELRDSLERIRSEAQEAIAEQLPNLEILQTELATLGPAPAEGEAPEAAGLAAQRKELTSQLAKLEAPIKQAELVANRAARLLADVAEIRRSRFAKRIFTRGPSPLSADVWRRALPQITTASRSFTKAAGNVISSQKFRQQLRDSAAVIGIAVLMAIVLAWPLRYWLLKRFGRDPKVEHPSFIQALRAMLVVGAVRALLPTAAAALVYIVFLTQGLLTPAGKEVAQALFLAFVFFVWVMAFFRASLSPKQPAWRILPVADNFARGIRGTIIGLALVFAVDIVVSEVIAIYGARLEITILRDYIIAVLVILLLVQLLLRQTMWMPSEELTAKPRWRSLRAAIAVTLLALVLLGAVGFVSLARFVATQLLLTGGLIFLLMILHRLGREFLDQATSTETWLGEQLRGAFHIDEEGANRLRFWTGLSYDTFLLLIGIVIGLFVWGADRQDVASWTRQALFGVQVGKITISLVDVFIASAIFLGLLFVTRLIQRTLQTQILPQTRLDRGIRESIRIGVGYLGIIIAAVAGIAALGLDLSNLAIIAGALTVGIGFGLQNIVNNFVSGLILLVERPLKIGDWIVVGDQQGYVKRIKVRATEIQTFDRASVFVPNSELISGKLINWTHADKLGRVIIPVGIAYGSDTKRVREVLQEIGNRHPQVLDNPAPNALFRSFGDSALNFELRCFLKDVEQTLSVTSDLCFAIDAAFREEGIEIPFPQQDIHIKRGANDDAPGST